MEDHGQSISTKDKKIQLKCKYFNSGYSIFVDNCKFKRAQSICSDVFCRSKECSSRHPQPCRYQDHCRRQTLCLYLHKPADAEHTAFKDEIKTLKYNKLLLAKLEAVTIELETSKEVSMKANTEPDGNKSWAMAAKELMKQKAALKIENEELKADIEKVTNQNNILQA